MFHLTGDLAEVAESLAIVAVFRGVKARWLAGRPRLILVWWSIHDLRDKLDWTGAWGASATVYRAAIALTAWIIASAERVQLVVAVAELVVTI